MTIDQESKKVRSRLRHLNAGTVAILWDPSHSQFTVVEIADRAIHLVWYSGDSVPQSRKPYPLTYADWNWPRMLVLPEDDSARIVMQRALAPDTITTFLHTKVQEARDAEQT